MPREQETKANSNGWNEWSKHVLAELNRLNDSINDLEDTIEGLRNERMKDTIKNIERADLKQAIFEKEFTKYKLRISEDITNLKVKAGVWGLIAGAIPVAIGLIMLLLKNAN